MRLCGLRSGKGFLPPIRKNPQWTGTLVRRYNDPTLGYTAEAFKGKSTPAPGRLEQLRTCESIEERLFLEDLQREAVSKSTAAAPRLTPQTFGPEPLRPNGLVVSLDDARRRHDEQEEHRLKQVVIERWIGRVEREA